MLNDPVGLEEEDSKVNMSRVFLLPLTVVGRRMKEMSSGMKWTI